MMTSKTISVFCVLCVALGMGLAEGQLGKESNGPTRLTVFISDLHFGVGRDPNNRKLWHPMEDFRWQDEFSQFLSFLKAQSETTDLILNGDTFELWQSIKDDCVYADADLGCSEQEALGRIQRVISEHRPELDELAAFARFGDNHLHMLPGNHDAALLFQSVREEVAKTLNVPAKVHIGETPMWQSPDRFVYAEHGHQIGKDVNSWKDLWPKPFLTVAGTTHLKRPWGEKFVQDYYNQFESKYSIIDNISEEGTGIAYARAAEGIVATVRDVGEFFNFVFFKVSRDQFVDSLGEKDASTQPEWDLEAIRARGPVFLLEALPPNHPFASEVRSLTKQKDSEQYFRSLSDDELVAICDERARQRGDRVCPKVVRELGAVAEALGKKFFGDTVLAKHLDITCRNLQGCIENPFQTFIYSHTHLAVPNLVPIREGSWNPVVFNTGAWQRTITPKQLKTLSGGIKEEEVLRFINPEDLPKCYSVVIIGRLKNHEDIDTGPRLRFWTKRDGNWNLENTCNDSDLANTAAEVKQRRDQAIE